MLPKTEENKIIIKKPYVNVYKHKDGETLYRLNAEIIENGKPYIAYVEVKEEYGKYLCSERSDAFLYLTLPVAMREKYDIYCEAPVTDQLLYNINEILVPHLSKYDNRMYPSKIFCETVTENMCGEAIGTAISCGVDSMYTVMEQTNKKYPTVQLTHLYIASLNAELWNTKNATIVEWINEHKTQFDRFKIVSDELKLPLVSVYSNFFDYVCSRDWKRYHHLFTHQYITMASVLALKKLWKMYFFSSADDFSIFSIKNNATEDTDRYDLLSMHVLTQAGFTCYCGGAKATRVEKTKALMNYPLAQKVLHPCHTDGKMNCTNPDCPKCLRGLFVFDYYDTLDNMKEVFDIERYRKNKHVYFLNLVRLKDNEFFTELFEMMKEKYPKEMQLAITEYENSIKPVPSAIYNNVKKCYNMLLALMSLEKPKDFLVKFFKDRGVNTLYTTGFSLFGSKVIELIKDEISVKNKNTGKASECDAGFILQTTSKDIVSERSVLRDFGLKQAYTIYDIYEEYLKLKKQ